MEMEFVRHEPCHDRILFVLTLDRKKMKERILIGEESEIRLRLAGIEEADVLYDETRPLGKLIVDFEHDEQRSWNEFGLMPLYNALHTNRWQQPGLEKTSGSFLAEKYAAGDPVRMYAAFHIWNEYLKARLPRERDAAGEHFLQKMSALTLAFHTDSPLDFDKNTGKPIRFDLTRRMWSQIPEQAIRLDLWYPDRKMTTECVSAYYSFYPLLIYYMNRLSDWGLNFCKCKVCGKVFLAQSLRYELCSDKCRKKQALQNKREFDQRARENNYDLLYKNECQNWRNKINKAKKTAGFPAERLEEMLTAFEAFKKEALQRKKAVKERTASPNEFTDWLYQQNHIIVELADY